MHHLGFLPRAHTQYLRITVCLDRLPAQQVAAQFRVRFCPTPPSGVLFGASWHTNLILKRNKRITECSTKNFLQSLKTSKVGKQRIYTPRTTQPRTNVRPRWINWQRKPPNTKDLPTGQQNNHKVTVAGEEPCWTRRGRSCKYRSCRRVPRARPGSPPPGCPGGTTPSTGADSDPRRSTSVRTEGATCILCQNRAFFLSSSLCSAAAASCVHFRSLPDELFASALEVCFLCECVN